MSGFITQDHGIGAVKSETSYGTDAFGGGAPADTDVLPFANLALTQTLNVVEGDRLTATAAGECHGLSPQNTAVEWDVILTGSTGPGLLPNVDAILHACGFAATVDASTSVSYSPTLVNDSTTTPSATFLHYERVITSNEARRIMARGVKSNLAMTLTMGAEARISGSGIGLYNAYPNAPSALPTLPDSYGGDQCAWIVNSLVLSVGNVNYPVNELTFATNWTLLENMTGAASGGGTTSRVLLTLPKSGARFGGSFNLVDGAAALTAAINGGQSGAKLALSATITKGARTIVLTIPAVQLGIGAPTNEVFAIPYFAVRVDGTNGNDHVSLVFA